MKVYNPEEIKNVTLIGASGSGKTILAEAVLFQSGIVSRKGEIENKNTISDYHEIEHETSSSVHSTVLYAEYNDKKINFIDAPGADNFIGGMVAALNVTDTAIMVLNSKNGIEVGTEIHWRVCQKRKTPTVVVVNQLDSENANYEKTIEDSKQLFGSKATVIQYPVNAGPGFNAIIDVLTMKKYVWDTKTGKYTISDIPSEEQDKATELHNELVETAAENDEELMEIYFEKGSLSEEEMRNGIRLGLIEQDIIPIFCMSAKEDVGVDRFLEFVTNVLPSPNQMPAPKATNGTEIKPETDAKTSLFVFKTSIEEHLGEVNYFKVMSGKLTEGQDLLNRNRDNKERFSQLYLTSGKKRTKISEIAAGDIAAVVKLKETKTNHTVSDKDLDIKFPEMEFPSPKHRSAIKAVNEADEEKLGDALHKLNDQDLTLVLEYSKELKQLIVHGQGVHHLNTMKWHLDNIYKVEAEFITPKIPYRETITKNAQAYYRHKKQSGGAGQFGEVHLIIDPVVEGQEDPKAFKIDGKLQNISIRDKSVYDLKWGGKLIFHNCIVGGVIDNRFMPAILKGINEKMEEGPLTGSYARDIRVFIYDGKMHPVDSNEISFKIAGSKAFSDAFKKAGPKIMEPVYDVEVLVPSDRMGDVMSDLQGRRSIIMGMNSAGGYEKLNARVPLAEMNNYSTSLRSLTNGRATYNMKFAEYTQVPPDVQEKLLKAYEAEQSEE